MFSGRIGTDTFSFRGLTNTLCGAAKVMENFDNEAVEGEGVLTTTVKFVVETNGTVSQVKATGSNADFNREAERVVRSIKGWKPAKKEGVNVKSAVDRKSVV